MAGGELIQVWRGERRKKSKAILVITFGEKGQSLSCSHLGRNVANEAGNDICYVDPYIMKRWENS